MRQSQFTCSRQFVQHEAEACIQRTLRLKDSGRKVPALLLARLLLLAASLGHSLSAATRRTPQSPSDETVRQAVAANLPPWEELTERLVKGFHAVLPRRLRRRAHQMAIDLHARPYYGDRQKTHGIRGGKAEAGTKWFWTYATCAIVERGRRWNVALVPVGPHEPMEDVLARLLAQIRRAGLEIRCLLLDRGFYSAQVIHQLQQRKIRFLMPMIRRGKRRGRGAQEETGTQRFFRRGTAGFFDYQWTARGKKKAGPTVTVRVACVPRPGQGPLVYVFHGPGWSLHWIHDTYRKRFGIETSYRQLGEGLARTTSRDACYRLLLVGVALLLRNLWVWSQTLAMSDESVSLNLILDWLRLGIGECLGCIDAFRTKTKPRPALAA